MPGSRNVTSRVVCYKKRGHAERRSSARYDRVVGIDGRNPDLQFWLLNWITMDAAGTRSPDGNAGREAFVLRARERGWWDTQEASSHPHTSAIWAEAGNYPCYPVQHPVPSEEASGGEIAPRGPGLGMLGT